MKRRRANRLPASLKTGKNRWFGHSCHGGWQINVLLVYANFRIWQINGFLVYANFNVYQSKRFLVYVNFDIH